VLLAVVATPQAGIPQAQAQRQHSREQTEFGAEGAFRRPVPLPAAALEALRTAKFPDSTLQDCAEQAGIRVEDIPASWFVASELQLSRAGQPGLIVRGENRCLWGAHIVQFWVLAKSATRHNVVLGGRADGLEVLPTYTNGYRDLQLVLLMRAGATTEYVRFRYSGGEYHASGESTRDESPDGIVTAIVAPAGKRAGSADSESRISVRRSYGSFLRTHDFSSADGQHGYGVDGAEWTPDSQYFVVRLRSSGGHSPMFAPVVFWSRKANRFYSLKDCTADQTFSVAAPDKVEVSTWPDMKPATVSLHEVKESEVTESRTTPGFGSTKRALISWIPR